MLGAPLVASLVSRVSRNDHGGGNTSIKRPRGRREPTWILGSTSSSSYSASSSDRVSLSSCSMLTAGRRKDGGMDGCHSRTKGQPFPLLAAGGLRSHSLGHSVVRRLVRTAGSAGPPVAEGRVRRVSRGEEGGVDRRQEQSGSLPVGAPERRCCGRCLLLRGARPTDTVRWC